MAQIGGGIVASRVTGTMTDNDGNALLSTATASDDPSELGFGGALWRYITTGLLNSDFAYGTVGQPFSPTSAPSYWTWNVASGTSVTGSLVADTTVGSGSAVRLQLATGSAGDDAYLEQIVKIVSSTNRAFSFSPYGYALATVGSADAEFYLKMQFLTRTGAATGAEVSNALTTSTFTGGLETGLATPTSRIPPADAYFARVRYGLRRRSGGATSATSSVTLYETYMVTGHPRLHVADTLAPDTYGVASISQFNGRLYLYAGSDVAVNTDENQHVYLFPRRVLAGFFTSGVVAGTSFNPGGELMTFDAAAPVTITAAPTVADGSDGQIIRLINEGANAVTIQDQGTLANSNLRLSTATFAIGPRDNITLVYDNSIGDWIEVSRTNVI